MNRGLISKAVHEVWLSTLLLAVSIALTELLLIYILQLFSREMSDTWLRVKIVQKMIQGLLGTSVAGGLGGDVMAAIPWVHPLILILTWAHAIALCTRLPVGEIDRGTIDVLLSLPASRTRHYCCESIVWFVAGAAVITAALIGNAIGNRLFSPDAERGVLPSIIAAANLFMLYLAVGGITRLISSIASHRGRAIAVAFGVVFTSFLLNFLAQSWPSAQSAASLSVLNYYQPLAILGSGIWPVADLATLAAVALALWLAAAVIFTRRDIQAA